MFFKLCCRVSLDICKKLLFLLGKEKNVNFPICHFEIRLPPQLVDRAYFFWKQIGESVSAVFVNKS